MPWENLVTTTTTATYYIATSKARRTKKNVSLKHEIGDIITVKAGLVHEYGDEHPAWTEGEAERFTSLGTLLEFVNVVAQMPDRFELVPGTIEYYKVDTVTHTTHERVDVGA